MFITNTKTAIYIHEVYESNITQISVLNCQPPENQDIAKFLFLTEVQIVYFIIIHQEDIYLHQEFDFLIGKKIFQFQNFLPQINMNVEALYLSFGKKEQIRLDSLNPRGIFAGVCSMS